jgi:hypothetical protein
LRFALEAGHCLRVAGNIGRQELEGNEAVKPRESSALYTTPMPPPSFPTMR